MRADYSLPDSRDQDFAKSFSAFHRALATIATESATNCKPQLIRIKAEVKVDLGYFQRHPMNLAFEKKLRMTGSD
jgi:hypothetical protein